MKAARTVISLGGKAGRKAIAMRHRLQDRSRASYSAVYYVIERRNWAIAWDGRYITRAIERRTRTRATTTTSSAGISRQVVHFGSRPAFFSAYANGLDPTNRAVFTWFHGDEQDGSPATQYQIDSLPTVSRDISRIVTSCSIGSQRLARWGVPEEKTVTIPLGVDLDRFKPADLATRTAIRERLGVPRDALCIGSFQKDGVGWGDGNAPKLIKGPDIFLDVVEQLARHHRIFVLLTGPARGYVTQGLLNRGVAFNHTYLKNYWEIVPYYQALDLYLVTSRDEGGPKAVLEAMATGVPLVSTRVGMAPDVVTQGVNGFLADVEDVEELTLHASTLATNRQMRDDVRRAALKTVAAYDWNLVARTYFTDVYRPLLSDAPGYPRASTWL